MPKAHQAEYVYLIKRLNNLMNQRIDEVLKAHGMARSQFQVLYRLQKSGTLTQKELLEHMKVEPATLSGLIDTLEGKGFVARSSHTDDRRSKRLELTDLGRKAVSGIPHPGLLAERTMFKDVSSSDLEAFKQTAQKVIENLESANELSKEAL